MSTNQNIITETRVFRFLKIPKAVLPYIHQVSHKSVCKLLTKPNKIDQLWRMTFKNKMDNCGLLFMSRIFQSFTLKSTKSKILQ